MNDTDPYMVQNPLPKKKPGSNFTASEDVMLASAYVAVMTDAAKGTDQDGNTFWERIKEGFISRGGLKEQTRTSLKNRFNKVLQAEVNKYIGILHGVFQEYKSGWSMPDYVTEAKGKFQILTGKNFKHELVYNILKRLPKYEIARTTIHPKVSEALSLFNNDTRMDMDCGNHDENNEQDTANGDGGNNEETSVETPYCTPRPTVGKKRAKMLASLLSSAAKQAKNTLLSAGVTPPPAPNVVVVAVLAEKKSTNAALDRLADAADRRNFLMCEQLTFQMATAKPQSDIGRAYFATMASRFTNIANMNTPATAGTACNTISPDLDIVDRQHVDVANQHAPIDPNMVA